MGGKSDEGSCRIGFAVSFGESVRIAHVFCLRYPMEIVGTIVGAVRVLMVNEQALYVAFFSMMSHADETMHGNGDAVSSSFEPYVYVATLLRILFQHFACVFTCYYAFITCDVIRPTWYALPLCHWFCLLGCSLDKVTTISRHDQTHREIYFTCNLSHRIMGVIG